MVINSVVDLRRWVAVELQQLFDNDDVDFVVRYIRRKTAHPMYGLDWSGFLKNIDCRSIILKN